jgi:hypothetical protein
MPAQRDASATKQELLDLAPIAIAVAGAVSLFASLSVEGVLGRAQRNHPTALSWAFALLIIGAAIPLMSILLGRRRPLALPAAVSFAGGLFAGINAIVNTQDDKGRPRASGDLRSKDTPIEGKDRR